MELYEKILHKIEDGSPIYSNESFAKDIENIALEHIKECCADKKQDVFITHTTNPNDIYCAFLNESEAIKEAKESGTTHTKITLYK